MGKKFLIYLESGVSDEFQLEENKSNIVSGLLKKHYSESIEAIEAQKKELEAGLRKVKKKLKNKLREAKAERIRAVRQELGGEKSKSGLYNFLKEYPANFLKEYPAK